ncbi:hypothetical protein [Niallia sp. 01092]|uniref:hypothetical protein n=1 Tax=unclassified Niallia TaxID=2837522 RepID=UPI003FD09787
MKTEAYLQSDYQSMEKKSISGRLVGTIGIWLDGKTYWIQNGYEKLIPEQAISVHIKHVPKHSKIQYNEIFVRNHSVLSKQMKVLMLNYYSKPLDEQLTFVSPTDNVIFHTVNNHLFLVNGETSNGSRIEQKTVQPLWNVHTELIWSNNANGILKYQPMGKGASVSIFSLNLEMKPQSIASCKAWTIHGAEKKELMDLNQLLIKNHTSIS